METFNTDDITPDDDDEPQPGEPVGEHLDPPEFGEQDEAAQEAEWAEDAREGGTSES